MTINLNKGSAAGDRPETHTNHGSVVFGSDQYLRNFYSYDGAYKARTPEQWTSLYSGETKAANSLAAFHQLGVLSLTVWKRKLSAFNRKQKSTSTWIGTLVSLAIKQSRTIQS